MNSLVTEDELLNPVPLTPEYSNIGISDIQLILILHEEAGVARVVLIEPDYKNSELILVPVGSHVEAGVFWIVDHLLNG